ncbi:hypothetical protein JQ038_05605 [Clostridium botulinum]|nr:hypothetical protein [Clostridium botulinum]MCS4480976.1 hypothetical protein [Clostridium botulinum]MCS4482213.1 hypothetical protein [Clostridium botulinum]
MNKIFKTLSIIALSAIITFASSSAAFAATPKMILILLLLHLQTQGLLQLITL